ncbi:MAG: DNA polymerase III subunit alpha [Rhodothalassiaceae bacterium]
MPHADFVHLRVHSAYSLSEGALRVSDLARRVLADRQPAVAVTDTDNLFGALEVSESLAAQGIQPILGVNLGVLPPQPTGERTTRPAEPARLILLAQNATGYRHLMKLVSRAHLASRSERQPALALADFDGLTEGLIALTGGPQGLLAAPVAGGHMARARDLLDQLKTLFPDRLYMELMRHGLAEEEGLEPGFLDLAYDADVPLVATNDVYFGDAAMYEAHDALLCIASGAYVVEQERRRLTPDHALKSAEAMRALFSDLPEAVDNTLVIAQRCAFKAEPIDPILPRFAPDRDEADLLREQAEAGLEERLAVHVFSAEDDAAAQAAKARPYRDRLAHELSIINRMGFPGYFLIVSDFIRWAKGQGIPVGPGRGSGAGSAVAWALKITDLDPLRFSLLFERFLNPERVSMPDFDVDFCQDRREEVIRYVQQRYGTDRVAQIITFGKFQARMILRDVGRVMHQPYPVTDRLCKMVPNIPANPVTLQEAIDDEPRLQEAMRGDETTAAVVDRALKLEGLYRHASTHAAGVVIGDRPLDELVPLYRDPRSDMPVTQFNMKWVEQAGLVKFDFLGLKTLTVLDRAVGHIAKRGIKVDLAALPLDDPATFEMLSRGDSAGVFQLESQGMRQVLKGLKPDKFEDIIAIVALYRPGPMDNIPTFVNRKHGREKVAYPHPQIAHILEETYGIAVYQEQVMQIAQVLAGYSLGEADLLRRAMGKKKVEEMARQRVRFVEGAKEKGVDETKANEIYDLLAKFAGYGFNKSHAAAYALIAYQTAYLKANYPVEFMAAIMSLDMGNTDKLAQFKKELRRSGIDLLLPDVNRSGADFVVERVSEAEPGDARAGLAIRYALGAIKGVGAKAIEQIVAERQANGRFADVFDFAERVDPKLLNKRQLEQLAAAGAFDALHADRGRVYRSGEVLLRHAQQAQQDRQSQQATLFGDAEHASRPALADGPAWLDSEKLAQELAAIGFYLSAHPLDAYQAVLKRQHVLASAEVLSGRHDGPVRMAGAIDSFSERKTRTGKRMGILTLSDTSGGYEVTVFPPRTSAEPDLLETARALVERAVPLLVTVDIRRREEEDGVRLTARDLRPLDDAAAQVQAALEIFVRDATPLEPLAALLSRHAGGRGMVSIVVPLEDSREAVIALPERYRVTPQIRSALASLPGVQDVQEV